MPSPSNRSPRLLAPLEPYGRCLFDFHGGKKEALLGVNHSLDGLTEIPAEIFFRTADHFFDFEIAALAACRGRVLDIGAGTGLHCLELQERGFEVIALEIVPQAVQIMHERGVQNVIQGDVYRQALPEVDTALLLMNGTGLAGTLEGLAELFRRLHSVVRTGGQILLDSADPGTYPGRGGYPGEATIQLCYAGEWGQVYPELYCDFERLRQTAESENWEVGALYTEADGTFVARLSR